MSACMQADLNVRARSGGRRFSSTAGALAGRLGSHFVVATGIASDGSLLIADPNPAFGQTSLNGYLNGFHALREDHSRHALGRGRLLPQAPSSPASW